MSTSNPTPSLRQVIAEIKQYLSLQCEWVKLDSVEKLTRIVSSLIFLILAIILIAIALLYLSLSVVHLIQIYTGAVAAYSIMAGFFLLLFNKQELFSQKRYRIHINYILSLFL